MFKLFPTLFLLLVLVSAASAQEIRVNPTGVNVNSQGATSVFLAYAPLKNYRPVDACWCGELIPAAPDLGFKCDPATVFGCLPVRYDHSSLSQTSVFTDIMSIPPSVVRRAYQAAQQGADSRFFYVRHFVSTAGAPDQFVAVTCRLTGGGARTPFSLTDVKLSFNSDKPVLLVKPGERLPEIKAEITYTGTGRLTGRWEVVKPGEDLPDERDLLTEATLPVEQRPLQRRYTQISRFNVFLPPVGKFVLPGPEGSKLPATVEGGYLILLRIEASDDKEADTDLAAIGEGPGIIHSGAVAGFPLPPLRYFVGSGTPTPTAGTLALLSPGENERRAPEPFIDFKWEEVARAAFYKLELANESNETILVALLPSGITVYRMPSWVKDLVTSNSLRWRVMALDENGRPVSQSNWRLLQFRSQGKINVPTGQQSL